MTSTSTPYAPGQVRRGGRDHAPVIHEHLRAEILKGFLIPGSEIGQAPIADRFGVSRSPVRKAFRLLERDGLIDARVNHRADTTGLAVEELEHRYTLRVRVRTDMYTFDFDAWDEAHQRFHMLLLAHSGSQVLGSTAEWAAHTQRYRRANAEDGRDISPGAVDHAVMAQLCHAGDARGAARVMALHLSLAALSLIAPMTPTHEPALLRAATRQVVGPDDQRRAVRMVPC